MFRIMVNDLLQETGTRQKLIEVCDEYAQHDFHMQ